MRYRLASDDALHRDGRTGSAWLGRHNGTVRYRVTIELSYLGNREPMPADARESLTNATLVDLTEEARHLRVTDLTILNLPDNTAVISALVDWAREEDPTSPIEAIHRFDDSLKRALYRTGLLEECDLARRVLRVEPSPQRPTR